MRALILSVHNFSFLTTYPISLGGSGSFGAPILLTNAMQKTLREKVENRKELLLPLVV
jgi:hypothetical protein